MKFSKKIILVLVAISGFCIMDPFGKHSNTSSVTTSESSRKILATGLHCGQLKDLKFEGGQDALPFVITFRMEGVTDKIYLMSYYEGDHPDPDGLYEVTILDENKGVVKATSGKKVLSCPKSEPNPAKG